MEMDNIDSQEREEIKKDIINVVQLCRQDDKPMAIFAAGMAIGARGFREMETALDKERF